MKAEASQALEGRTIAEKFLIESIIGQGAMGAVYRAKWLALDKAVALKVMKPEIAGDPAFAARFHREAKAASRLDHPNSVRVLDFGEEPDGLLYIAMEFLDGKDLLALMRADWPLSGERIISVLMQTLSALALAHELGIVHRDLKPENIMILAGTDDEGRPADVVKVCDFGIAKITNDRSGATPSLAKGPLTSSGTLVGTPEYMSPEQGKGDELDARSDLYSVGVILFHMLTGRVPFMAENAIGIILKHITDDPPRPTSIVAHVDPRLEGICLKAMRKRREERYLSAREMRSDLRAVREQVLGSPAIPPAEPSRPLLVGTAATMNDVVHPASSPSRVEGGKAPTAAGLAVPAVTRPRRAWWVAGVAVTAALVGVVLTVSLFGRRAPRGGEAVPVRGSTTQGSTELPVAALGSAPAGVTSPTTAAEVEPPAPMALPSVPSVFTPEPAPAHRSGVRGGVSRARPAISASTSSPPVPSPSSALPMAPISSVAAPPSSSLAAAIAPAPAAPEEAPYDPSRAVVDVGSVTPSNVNGDAVRGAVRGASLTACYRNALRARGRKAFGSATLNLSIDGTGKVSGAILTGADWLPEMTRCIQGNAAGLQLRPGTVEQGGGTAEIWLSFRAP